MHVQCFMVNNVFVFRAFVHLLTLHSFLYQEVSMLLQSSRAESNLGKERFLLKLRLPVHDMKICSVVWNKCYERTSMISFY